MCTLTPVIFHNDTIFVLNHQNEPFTPMKTIVENMGLAWQSQATKLNSNKERWGIKEILIPTKSGSQKTLCMPVRKLPAFMASISPNKCKTELRPQIIKYQNECDDVLWNYWSNHDNKEQKTMNTLPDIPKEISQKYQTFTTTLSEIEQFIESKVQEQIKVDQGLNVRMYDEKTNNLVMKGFMHQTLVIGIRDYRDHFLKGIEEYFLNKN